MVEIIFGLLAFAAALVIFFSYGWLQPSNYHMAAMRDTEAGAVTLNPMTAVADPMFTTANGGFIVPPGGQILAVYGFGANLTDLQMSLPSLRQIGLPSLWPFNIAAGPVSPLNGARFFDNPVLVNPGDTFAINDTQSGAGTADAIIVAAFGQAPPRTAGQKYRLKFTATINGVDGSWANGALTPQQTLLAGVYSIVGMECYSVQTIAARLAIPGASWRPGCICQALLSNQPDPIFQSPLLGEWGRFTSLNLPSLDVYIQKGGATAAQTLLLDVIYLGPVGSVPMGIGGQ